MDLYLRKVIHNQAAPDGYRVVLKNEYGETEIGSIGLQHCAGAQYFWKWAIDTVIPMRTHQTQGRGADRADCVRQFKEAWARFCLDEANLTMFMAEKRKRR
jgi:hypothetical protein